MKKNNLIDFDPNGPGLDNGQLYGLPFSKGESELILLEVPRDITVSYRMGTHKGPSAILDASRQVELYDPFFPDVWKYGIYLDKASENQQYENLRLRAKAAEIIRKLEAGLSQDGFEEVLQEINESCENWDKRIKVKAERVLNSGKICAVLGGDHSSPLGLLQALASRGEGFGVLQIDAHMDLRKAYEGFEYSHASIMYNALQIPEVSRIVQVGIRDYSEEELNLYHDFPERLSLFSQRDIDHLEFRGVNWASQVSRIIEHLPEKVYLSFDIDGLNPSYCPDTGTPVPGGLSMAQAIFLIESLVKENKEIIGFDLCEVAPGKNEWNGIVGARLLYRLCACTLKSKLNKQNNE